MPLTGQASRFAVLPDDDSTDWQPPKSRQPKNAARHAQSAQKSKSQAKKAAEMNALRSAAFGGSQPGGGKKGKKNRPTPPAAAPVPDSATLDETPIVKTPSANHSDQAQAGDQPIAVPTPPVQLPLVTPKPMGVPSPQPGKPSRPPPPGVPALAPKAQDETSEEALCQRLHEDAMRVLKREKELDSVRRGPVVNLMHEIELQNDVIRRYRGALSMKEVSLVLLKRQNEDLQANIWALKKQNRELLSLVGQGEDQEKAGLISAWQDVEKIKTELDLEVTRLRLECEQERIQNRKLAGQLEKAGS